MPVFNRQLYLLGLIQKSPVFNRTHSKALRIIQKSPVANRTCSRIFTSQIFHKFTTHIPQFPHTLIYQFTNLRIHKITNSPPPISQFPHTLIYQFTNLPIHELLAPTGPQTQPARECLLRKHFTNSQLPISQFSHTLIHKFTNLRIH